MVGFRRPGLSARGVDPGDLTETSTRFEEQPHVGLPIRRIQWATLQVPPRADTAQRSQTIRETRPQLLRYVDSFRIRAMLPLQTLALHQCPSELQCSGQAAKYDDSCCA